MNVADLWKFVKSQKKMIVSFVGEGGYPHSTPIWFCVIGERIYIRAQSYKEKIRLARKGKASCVWEDGSRYRELRGVVMWGQSRIVTDPKLEARVNLTMNGKYRRFQWTEHEMPPKWVRERRKERRVIVEITPRKISSWDNSKV